MAIAKLRQQFTFNELGRFGRLGNQLFQIAATVGFARKNNGLYSFPQWPFAKYFKSFPKARPIGQKYDELSEPTFHYNDLVLDLGCSYDLKGYFQSELNFAHCAAEVRKLFQFSPDFLEPLKEKYLSQFTGPLCAVHVRRGDYVSNPNYYSLPVSHYLKAMAKLGWMQYIVFSDDIAWCRQHMPDWCHFVETKSEINDFALMTQCDHFIIANSSFSWWAAWLGEKENTRVVAPAQWFSGTFKYQHNAKDVIPDRWEKIGQVTPAPKGVRTDLKDVTFTIPIRIDHQDRIDNLQMIIGYLNHHFDTNIYVIEQDVTQKINGLQGCRYEFFPNRTRAFERTFLLNYMARRSETPIIANYDCDVVFQPRQIVEAVQRIRDGKADGMSPYDGMFLRAWRTKLDEFCQEYDVDVLDLGASRKEHFEHYAVGGAVFWNKEGFIRGGMENERMISYGPEDYERVERFKKLGFRLDRVDGPLIHINHWVGTDSTEQNPWFKKNWDEYRKIQGMSQRQMEDYVASWPWPKQLTHA